MDEKRSAILDAIKNPLSIIALFVLVLDIVMTVIIANSHVTDIQRSILIWFFVLFPFIVLVAFFVLVWFKPENLYGPKDYSNEAYFYKLMRQVKIEKEVDEVIDEEAGVVVDESGKLHATTGTPVVSRSSVMRKVEYSELYALSEIGKEFKVKISKPDSQKALYYDGEFTKDSNKYLIEVKYLRSNSLLKGGKVLYSLEKFLQNSSNGEIRIIALVSDLQWNEELCQAFEAHVLRNHSQVIFRYYTLPHN